MKREINSLLARITGYELQRCVNEDALTGTSDQDLVIIKTCRPYTMTSNVRLLNTILATRYVASNAIEGGIVECGVWRGGSCMAIAHTLNSIGVRDRDIFLFDTFTGMSAPGREDIRISDLTPASSLPWNAQPSVVLGENYQSGVAAFGSKDEVWKNLRSTGYPTKHIHLIQGDILETFPTLGPENIALLRLDTDWYETTRHELFLGWPRLAAGGVVIVDDYDYWAGARQATDEFVDGLAWKPMLVRMDEGRVFLKGCLPQ